MNDESLEQDTTMLLQEMVGGYLFSVVALNVILGLSNWLGSIIVATFF